MTKTRVYVVGVGMTKFEKPGRRADVCYPDMAKEAVSKALADAKISYKEVQQAIVGYVYGDSTCGQRAVYEVGLTGIPVYNVNNTCATGSSALYLAKQILETGNVDCVLALGFEKMEKGSRGSKFEKPGRRADVCYPDMAKEAVSKALADAKISYKEVQQAIVGYVYGDSTCGQRAVYEVGLTGIPVYNVNNTCATGSSALYLAKQILETGNVDCVLALGFEKMEKGSRGSKFEKPGRRADICYPDMAKEAVTKALADARISYNEVQQACVGYVYGDSTCGQRAVYEVGMTGIPVYNVNNNCSTGSSALYLAKQIIEAGNVDCVLALGFEKMEKGSLSSKFFDRVNPIEKHVEHMSELVDIEASPMAAQIFGNAGLEHMRKFGTKPEHFAKIAWKNHKHSVNNPYSQFRDEYTLEQIMKSPKVHGVLTKLQCCPTSDGSAAAIIASEAFVRRHGLEAQAVEIVGIEMASDPESTFKDKSLMKIAGYDMTRIAAQRLFSKSQYKPTDVDVVELHDCFSANELITYEALGLCEPGKAGELIDNGDNTYGGKYVINPSGGLISKGHPLGATGLAQCSELCWQLRGQAEKRQVANAKLALQHNLGLGGAVVIGLYRLGFPNANKTVTQNLTSASNIAESPEGFKVSPLLKALEQAMQEDTDNLIERVRAIYAFKVTNGPNGKTGLWIINAKEGKGKVIYNGKDKADITFIVADDDVTELISGKLPPQKAFFQGKVKIQGNMGLAMKLMDLQRSAQNRIDILTSKL